ncbi:MAG: nuclear transport factor 2 family protein [Pseudomonadota bacterium]
MKTYLALGIACLSWACLPTAQAQPQQPSSHHSHQHERFETQQRTEIESVLKGYEQSLNASDVEGVIQLYTDDAVLLAPDAPSAVGIEAVRYAYTTTFQAISLNIHFEIAEMKLLSPEWAFLRTNSTGVIKIVANGAQIPEGNQELFLLRKSHGYWKIARYSFSSFLRSAK